MYLTVSSYRSNKKKYLYPKLTRNLSSSDDNSRRFYGKKIMYNM